jgi:hypothetical protein
MPSVDMCIYLIKKQTNSTILFIINPTKCTNFPNLFWHETLHVSGSSSAHHQEFIHCTLDTGIRMTYTSAECTVNKVLIMGRGTAQHM